MNTYELTYIMPVKAGENNISSIQSRVEGILVENGCVKKNISNGFTSAQKKKFSYEIGKEQFGYYITVYFDADPLAIEKISKVLKLDNDILRYLIISVKGDIPQGVLVSKKEVEQQIDNAIEGMIAESKAQNVDLSKKEEALEVVENQEKPETRNQKPETDMTEKESVSTEVSEDKPEGEKKAAKKKEPKKKTSFEDLDKKLDEILE